MAETSWRLAGKVRDAIQADLFWRQGKLNRTFPKSSSDQSSSVICGIKGCSNRNIAESTKSITASAFLLRLVLPKISVLAASTNQSQ